MQLAIGVAKAAPGLLNAQGEKAKIRARNKAKREQYDFLLQQRKRDWQNQLSIWGAKRNKYTIDVTENDLAAHRGYAQAQAGLNAVYDQAAQNNEAALIKFLNKHGTLAAKGRTGRGVGRINVMELAEMERKQGREFHRITKSREAYLANIEQIEGKARSRRRGLRSQLGFAPVPQLAPPPPIMEDENVTGKIAAAALEGIFAGLSSGVTAPGIPTGGEEGGETDVKSLFGNTSNPFEGSKDIFSSTQTGWSTDLSSQARWDPSTFGNYVPMSPATSFGLNNFASTYNSAQYGFNWLFNRKQ